MPEEKKDAYASFFMPAQHSYSGGIRIGSVGVHVTIGIHVTKGDDGPFTKICKQLRLLDMNSGLQEAELIIEDLISKGIKPRKLEAVLECLGKVESAIDEIFYNINEIELSEYKKKYGNLPDSI